MANNNQELLDNVKIDLLQLGCNQPFVCEYNERTLSYAIGVDIPEPQEAPEEVFKECCYHHYVLADANSSSNLKNDFSSFYHQRQLPNETVNFVLLKLNTNEEFDLDNATYGIYYPFGNFDNNDLKGYRVQWKKVLSELGEGSYKILKKQNIAGIDIVTESLVYTLRQYSDRIADHTVRIDIVQNGALRKLGVDFTGANWEDSIRVRGFFGRREPQFEEDILVDKLFRKRQISMSQTNEYKFQTNLLPDCVTDQIIDFFVLANDIYFTDYNLNNHSYQFKKFAAKYASNEGTRYGSHTRKAQLNLVFNDKNLDNRKNNFY